LFCAIGFLTKGFPSIIFEGLTLFALCVFSKSIRPVFRWQHLAGIALFAALIGGYLYAYSFYSSPRILLADLLKESFNKSAFGEYPERFFSKVAMYPFNFLKILMPWSLLLLLLFKKHQFKLWSNPVIRFSILFILFNIPVYWFTGHPRMRYTYMFMPFCMILLAYIFYYFREEQPQFIYKITRYAAIVFVLIFAGILVVPFVLHVSNLYVGITVLLFAAFMYLNKKRMGSISVFVAGIVLIRLIYALVFIPFRYNHILPKYDREMANMAGTNEFQPVSIYMPPDTLNLVIDLKVCKMNFGTIPAIPYMAYQMPYYYYRNTGQVVRYDTILQPGKNYIGLRSMLSDLNAAILYSFRDKNQNNDEVVLFTVPTPNQAAASSPVKNFIKQ
jgi:hypothetical protein